MNNSQALTAAAAELQDAGIPEPLKEAGSLLRFALARDRAFIVAYPEYTLTQQERTIFTEAVRRRSQRVPFQQIAGRQQFYGIDFIVTPDVLIPRPETEILVERAIEIIGGSHAEILEIGLGSGCISVSILKNCPGARVLAVDISKPALEVAKRNAAMHDVNDRLELQVSDVYANVDDRQFQLIVSNPPYVPAADLESLQPEVRDHEPHIALTDGANGLSIIERIIRDAPGYLAPAGALLVEIGFGQHEAVEDLLDRTVWRSVDLLPDLQGIPRVLDARIA